MAKKFFYVCAGLFMLAGAYAIGAARAVAQAAPNEPAAICSGSPLYPFQLVVMGDGSARLNYQWGGWQGCARVPSVSPVVAGASDGGSNVFVVCQNGDVFTASGYALWLGSGWQNVGNANGGPTPAAAKTWGALKARSR